MPRSLYWRIAIGFVLFLVALLVLQGGAMVWLVSRMEFAPGPTPPEVTRFAARVLSDALANNAELDIEQFLRDEYEDRVSLVAIMRDGRVLSSDGTVPPDEVVRDIRARLKNSPESFPRVGRGMRGRGMGAGPRGDRFSDQERQALARERQERVEQARLLARQGWRLGVAAPILVNGELQGVVIAAPRNALRQLGPTVAAIAAVLVLAGTIAAALLIFGPARRRIGSLEEAARKVGAGDLSARAREDGGDEVAALARTFNQMTSDLQARADELQAADRARRLLLADVSHELMTPLTGMRGYLETLSLQEATLDAATRERYLSIIRDETLRVEHIVRDLLDLARLESGGDTFDAQDVPLEDVFGRVLARHGREAEQKGVTLTADITPGAEIVTGDPMRLEQALQNLAANALRHTARGGSVSLRAAHVDGALRITVADSGSGIAPEHLPRVFDRFYKADPARSGDTPGSGLGLSIVKAIVERHGASITAASPPGEGTVFTIVFPRDRPPLS